MYREHRPPYSATDPRVHDPAGDRDLAPRRVAAPRGSGFVMFRNPFPRDADANNLPYDPASRAYGEPYRYEFSG